MLQVTPGATIQPPAGTLLAVTVDTLVSGVHFPVNTSPEDIGHKALAVNLSDLAAMGAIPKWITLTLVLPEETLDKEKDWLAGFEKGLMALAEQHQLQLVEVNIHKGPLTITISAIGLVEDSGEKSAALLRSGAQPGDLIYVTGKIGDAGAALATIVTGASLPEQHQAYLLDRLNRPIPRIEAGLALTDIANAAIDISDGLVADLGHICKASGTGATIYADRLPLSDAMTAVTTEEDAIQFALTSGDDYELCFTVPEDKRGRLVEVFVRLDVGCTCIGKVDSEMGLRVVDKRGKEVVLNKGGFQHFE